MRKGERGQKGIWYGCFDGGFGFLNGLGQRGKRQTLVKYQ